ncbi:hypothetical protein QNH46_03285 [Paenibacillus woosongensis]|uniref:Uncharacterized protein n=1 Tax=Paenibacillus woosongensis TaxID=307580 RepID=A0AA95L227_9BACL|nr:hypothetical protein [Paenibacillus woosongensis]WHX49721.1 hypothetical protein QNH46_03285 [Paenibacillus woosongensis]
MKKSIWLIVSAAISLLSIFASFHMRLSTFDLRRQVLESSIEFDNAAALGLDLILFPIAIFIVHLVLHLAIMPITVFSDKYRHQRIVIRELFSFTKNKMINFIMVLLYLAFLYHIFLIFTNAYYPFWSKLVVCTAVFMYFIWLLQIIQERTVLPFPDS